MRTPPYVAGGGVNSHTFTKSDLLAEPSSKPLSFARNVNMNST